MSRWSSPRVTLAVAVAAGAARLAWGIVVRAPYVWDAELYERGAQAIAQIGRAHV